MKQRTWTMQRALLLGAAFAAALSALGTGCTETSAGERTDAADALESTTGVEWIVSSDERTGAIRFAAPKKGPYELPAGAAGEEATIAFLDAQKAIFKMRDPRAELVLDRTTRPSDRTTHVRFHQKVNGVPVRGGTWTAHFDASGRLASMSGNYVVGAHATPTSPSISLEAAAIAAKDEAARRNPSVPVANLQTTRPELEILPTADATPLLAWSVKVGTRGVAQTLSVDATSGTVRQVTEGILQRTATARAPQTYPPYNVDAPPVTFRISEEDPPRLLSLGPGPVKLQVSVYSVDAFFDFGAAITPVAATSLDPWTDGVAPPGAAAAAQAHAQMVIDYFADHRWGPDDAPYFGLDGTGRLPVTVYVNDNTGGGDNASFNTYTMTLHFGDGQPRVFPMSASLDAVAHEFTHGVTTHTSGLEYILGTESAALDESFSDVFSSLIGHRLRNDDAVDFTQGEDRNLDRAPLRSMIDPTRVVPNPGFSDMQALRAAEFAFPHAAGAIPSHAFYLLTHGGVHAVTRWKVPCGIGWAAADQLYWRLQTSHVQPKETFRDFALHSLAAARELGITESPLACAWLAVGVLTEDEVRNDWNVTCAKEGSAEAGGADASDTLLVAAPTPLVQCPSVSLTNGTGSLGP